MDDLFPGFKANWINTEAGRFFARSGGEGPPVILLHGFPQTHAMWSKVAVELARRHFVVCPDLRGYGWSFVPKEDEPETYSKRTMGQDAVAIMQELGHARFALVGHDRGARAGYRLALDQPGRIERLALLDILPTVSVWEAMATNSDVAPHWRFLSEPSPKPEQEIGKDPIRYYEDLLDSWSGGEGLKAFDWRALKLYRDSWNEPTRIHASCNDYRAGASVDLVADRVDLAAGKHITCPTLLLWGAYLTTGPMAAGKAPLAIWRDTFAPGITGSELNCGHFLAEEDAPGTAAALQLFLRPDA